MIEKMESKVFDEFAKKLIYEEDGIKKISQFDIEKLNLTTQEENFLRYVIKKYNVKIVDDKITKENRSSFVRDNNYGDIKGNGLHQIDTPALSNTEYSDLDELIYEDYSKLDEFIEKDFLEKNLQMKSIRNNDGEKEKIKSIRLCDLLELKLSEEEQEHVFYLLDKLDISVAGMGATYDGEFDNYKYVATYKSNLPEALTTEETMEKFKQFNETHDPKIRKEIIEGNMRLVIFVIVKLFYSSGVDLHDLEQYGYEGLIKAVDKFNPNMKYSFSTYAVSYIKGYILSGINELKNEKKRSDYYTYLNAKKAIEEYNGTTLEETPVIIDDMIDLLISNGKIKNDKKSIEVAKRKIWGYGLGNVSYENEEDLEGILGESILTDLDYYEEIALSDVLKSAILEALDTLLPMEKEFLINRFGLDGKKPKTLDELSEMYGISREKVRGIEARALRKLRHPSRSKKLRGFLE